MGFLDEAGLAHLWDKIKNKVTDYRVVTLTGNASASTKYPKYGFEYVLQWDGIEADQWVDGAVIAGDYSADWAIDSSDGAVTLYFATNPTATFGLIAGMEMNTVVAVTDYNIAIHMQDIGTVPDTTVIRELYENFQNGCSVIAEALTGQGVPTASTDSPTVIADNITTLGENKYREGYDAGVSGGRISVVVLTYAFSGWWNPDPLSTSYDYKTWNISGEYEDYQHITAANITPFIQQFSGQGGDNYRVIVGSYDASTGDLRIGCNGHLSHLYVSILIRPTD